MYTMINDWKPDCAHGCMKEDNTLLSSSHAITVHDCYNGCTNRIDGGVASGR